MKTSGAGIKLLKDFEGLRLKAYQCQAGRWTIGYGSTRGVKEGDVVTPAGAENLLALDVMEVEDAVEHAVKVDLTQGQFDALVCWAYNVGIGALAKSTLLKKLNAGDLVGAAAEFPKWCKIRGAAGELVVSKGLKRRREAERDLFLS